MLEKVFFLMFFFNFQILNATIYYVKEIGGGTESGESWDNASSDLQGIINIASVGDEVWVAKGTYYPTRPANDLNNITNSKDNSFVLKVGVKIYGGFSGVESDFNRRNWQVNNTILDGNGVNSYHVVISVNDVGVACLDGFIIQNGKAIGSGSIEIDSQIIPKNYGGGIFNINSSPTYANLAIKINGASKYGAGIYNELSSPLITGVSFEQNLITAEGDGGGMYNKYSNPILIDCNFSNANTATNGGAVCNNNSSPSFTRVIFSGNRATVKGGGIYNVSGAPTFLNVLISLNTVSVEGGGVYNENSSSVFTNVTIAGNTAVTNGFGIYTTGNIISIYNSIIWGNGANNDNLYYVTTEPEYKYSIVQGTDLSSNEGCLDGRTSANNDPLLDGSSYKLQDGSAVINKGDNSLFETRTTETIDLAGESRIIGGAIDFGAFENQNPLPIELLEFKANCENGVPKIIWKTASEFNNDYFILEESSDMISFNEIYRINGAGNSNKIIIYEFTYNKKHSDLVYYRLMQVDYDGRIKKYYTFSLKCNSDENSEIIFYGKNNFICKNFKGNSISYLVFDLSGKQIYKNLTENNRINTIPSELNGVYTIMVYDELDNYVLEKYMFIK